MIRFALILALPMLTGCLLPSADPSTRPVTEVDKSLADPATWWSRPTTAFVHHADFDFLWAAADRAARDLGFTPDRRNPRGGEMITFPLVSGQFFEFWRSDTSSMTDLAESSLGTVRRTLRFEIERADTGFRLACKVLVERNAVLERRLTSPVSYELAFRKDTAEGSREQDRGLTIPRNYWYPVARDEALELRLAIAVERVLRRR